MWVRFLLRTGILLIIGLPMAAQAATVAITEIMFDPPGSDADHEWVKIQNVSGVALDMKTWRFAEGGTNHKITPLGTSILQPNAYAVIAEDAATYQAEHSGTTDLIFDSSFSLNNTGEIIAIKDASSTVLVSETYTTPPPEPKAPTVSTKKSPVAKAAIKKSIPKFDETAAPLVTAPAASSADWSLWPWLLGLGALVIVGVGALFLVPKRTDSGYEIIDTSDK